MGTKKNSEKSKNIFFLIFTPFYIRKVLARSWKVFFSRFTLLSPNPTAQFSWTFITIIDFPVVWKDLSLKNDHAKSCALPAHFIQKLNIFNVDSTGFSIDKILISFKSSYIDQLQTSNLSSLIPLSRDGAFYVSHTFPDITHIVQYMYFFHGSTM